MFSRTSAKFKDDIDNVAGTYGQISKKDIKPVAGTKYNHVGSKRSGLSSYMDKGIIQHNLEQREKNYGNGGYAFQMLDKDGKADKNATLNIGGRIHMPRADGTFFVVDQDALDLAEREEKERKEYIKSVVRKVVISDVIGAKVLGLEVDDFVALCEPNGCSRIRKELNMNPKVDEYNCAPSYLDALDESSTLFTGGIQKLTKIVNGFMPIMEHATPASVENAGTE